MSPAYGFNLDLAAGPGDGHRGARSMWLQMSQNVRQRFCVETALFLSSVWQRSTTGWCRRCRRSARSGSARTRRRKRLPRPCRAEEFTSMSSASGVRFGPGRLRIQMTAGPSREELDQLVDVLERNQHQPSRRDRHAAACPEWASDQHARGPLGTRRGGRRIGARSSTATT